MPRKGGGAFARCAVHVPEHRVGDDLRGFDVVDVHVARLVVACQLARHWRDRFAGDLVALAAQPRGPAQRLDVGELKALTADEPFARQALGNVIAIEPAVGLVLDLGDIVLHRDEQGFQCRVLFVHRIHNPELPRIASTRWPVTYQVKWRSMAAPRLSASGVRPGSVLPSAHCGVSVVFSSANFGLGQFFRTSIERL
jgi:hypothetical protein